MPDFFYYFTDKEVKTGSLVKVKFRQKEVPGYVYASENLAQKRNLIKKTKLSLKPILEIINISPPLTTEQLKLAKWLKNYANISLATSLSMFLPYKFFLKINLPSFKNLNYKKKKPSFNYQPKLNFDNLKNKKVLIIVPRESYLKFLINKLQPDFVISSKISIKRISLLLKNIVGNEKKIFLGLKNAIFLPWQNLDELIIYEEGSYFYKDFFKPPYINYQKIFLKFVEINKVKYLAIDKLPSLNLIKDFKIKPQIKIDFERLTEKEFFNKLKESKKNLIFVPEKNLTQKLVCENCFQSLQCSKCQQNLIYAYESFYCRFCLKNYPLPEKCPHCQQKSNFMIKGKSAEIIFKQLSISYQNVFFLDKENNQIIKNFLNSAEAILIGSFYLLDPNLKGETLFFLNFEKFYSNYSFFQRELFLRVLTFFKNRVKKIYLVSETINHLIENKIKNGDWLEYLLMERKINNLPPFKRLIVLKEGSQNLTKLQQKLIKLRQQLEIKDQNLNIIGPIFSHPYKIRQRHFLELILRLDDNLNFNLRKTLENIDIEKIEIDSLDF